MLSYPISLSIYLGCCCCCCVWDCGGCCCTEIIFNDFTLIDWPCRLEGRISCPWGPCTSTTRLVVPVVVVPAVVVVVVVAGKDFIFPALFTNGTAV